MQLIKNYLNTLINTIEIKDLSGINTLIQRHLEQLPFCNIPILLNKNVSLELTDIEQKILIDGEGGYCFEHNKLMYEALLYLGFNVKPLFGRVLNNQSIEAARTHRMTLLTYENEQYLIDVGFGFMSPGKAIKFTSTPTTTFNRQYMIQQLNEEIFALQIILENSVYTLYTFDFSVCNEVDFEVSNFYSFKHKNANFVKNLVLSKISNVEVRSLRNNTYHKIYENKKEETIIDTLDEFTNILKSEFNYPINAKSIEYLFKKFVK